jgi:hypothetical protein
VGFNNAQNLKVFVNFCGIQQWPKKEGGYDFGEIQQCPKLVNACDFL